MSNRTEKRSALGAPAEPRSILAKLAACEDPLVAGWADALLHGEAESGSVRPAAPGKTHVDAKAPARRPGGRRSKSRAGVS
jgi:hypothetical protein